MAAEPGREHPLLTAVAVADLFGTDRVGSGNRVDDRSHLWPAGVTFGGGMVIAPQRCLDPRPHGIDPAPAAEMEPGHDAADGRAWSRHFSSTKSQYRCWEVRQSDWK
jgi:hypothetical protein